MRNIRLISTRNLDDEVGKKKKERSRLIFIPCKQTSKVMKTNVVVIMSEYLDYKVHKINPSKRDF